MEFSYRTANANVTNNAANAFSNFPFLILQMYMGKYFWQETM